MTESEKNSLQFPVKGLSVWFNNRKMFGVRTLMERRHPNRDHLSHYEVYTLLVDRVGILTETLGYIQTLESDCASGKLSRM
jgi:hypothetical protein